MDYIGALDNAARESTRLIAGVSDDQLNAPTPCKDWTVSDLIDHMVGGAGMFAGAFGGNAAAADTSSEKYANAYTALCEAARNTGFEGKVQVAAGEFEKRVAWGIALGEIILHGWDLASATGQTANYEEETLNLLLQANENIPDAYRDEKGSIFGLRVEAPEDASTLDKLAALMGRSV